MNTRMKSAAAAFAVSLGLAATPAFAQVAGTGLGYDAGRASGYHEDGTLNVFGAHIEPRTAPSGGLIGGVGNAVGGIVTGTGAAVGGVVGGVTGVADDVVTGTIGARRGGYASTRGGNPEGYARPAAGYGRGSVGPGAY